MTDFRAGPETFIQLKYAVFDAEGDPALPGVELVECVLGRGQLPEQLELGLEGLPVGGRCSVTIRARDAFGERDEAAIVHVARDEFPEDVGPGDRFEIENEHGELLVVHVLDVATDEVVVDFNHPLAGQDIRIDLEVADLRPATSEELEAAELALEHLEEDARLRSEGGPSGSQAGPEAGGPLIGIERLIRGGTRGYETPPQSGDSAPLASRKEASGSQDDH